MTNEERAEETRLKLESMHRQALLDYADDVRRECANRAVAWYNDPQDQLCAYEYDDEYWNNSLRAAIIATEPARIMHDLDPKVADCVQKHFGELIEPAREES